MQVRRITIEEQISEKIREINRKAKDKLEKRIESWTQPILGTLDFLFIFTGVLIILKTLYEEGVIA